MKLNPVLLSLVFFCTSVPAFAQNDSSFLTRAAGLLSKWDLKNPTEKVYLHLDRSNYAAGDDIWFKAYVVAGSNHQLSDISGILNVELINSADSIKQFLKLPLINGLSWGDFKLADTLADGIYRIRAYTNWMRNAGAEYFYDRRIRIGNDQLPGSIANKNTIANKTGLNKLSNARQKLHQIDVRFFPEGGNLVYGIESKVAFKAVGDDRLGEDIKGIIQDEQGHEITRFESRHLGMGVFSLLPVAGRRYKAQITNHDGTVDNINLPVPASAGYALSIDDTDPVNILVKIETCPGLLNNPNEGINLIGQCGGQIYYAAKSNAITSPSTTVIPNSRFPEGIVRFTLFSSSGEPLNERLVFIKHPAALNLSLSTLKQNYIPRENVKIDVDAKNVQGQPALGNFSVAVTNETEVPADEPSESTIFSNFLLTSELKGYIEKPNYYFADNSEKTDGDLDILMLTQGYRRFEWKEVLTAHYKPAACQPEKFLEISGRLTTLNGKSVANGKVSLLSSSAGFLMLDTVSDSNGHFVFKNLQFRDSTKFVIQSRTGKGKSNVKLTLDSPARENIVHNGSLPMQSFNADDSLAAKPADSNKGASQQVIHSTSKRAIALKQVTIRDRQILPNSSNLNGPGHADQVLLAKDIDTGCPSIALCLAAKLNFIHFESDPGKMVFYPVMIQNGKPVRMKIMVDGILMDAETLDTLPVGIVESVEVLRSGSKTSIYSTDAHTGLILINTKRGPDAARVLSSNIIAYTAKGYYKAREFYSPQYGNPETDAKTPDERTTIYWNPNVVTDKDGKASFQYFNADSKGKYRVVIEGIDGDGNLGRQVYHYQVE